MFPEADELVEDERGRLRHGVLSLPSEARELHAPVSRRARLARPMPGTYRVTYAPRKAPVPVKVYGGSALMLAVKSDELTYVAVQPPSTTISVPVM